MDGTRRWNGKFPTQALSYLKGRSHYAFLEESARFHSDRQAVFLGRGQRMTHDAILYGFAGLMSRALWPCLTSAKGNLPSLSAGKLSVSRIFPSVTGAILPPGLGLPGIVGGRCCRFC